MWAAATAQPDYYSTSDAAASQLHAQLPAHLPTGGGSTSSSSGGGGGGLPSLAPLYPLPSTPMPNFDMPLQGGGMRMNVGTVPMYCWCSCGRSSSWWGACRGNDDGRGGSGVERWSRRAVQAARGDPPVRHRPRGIRYAMPKLCARSRCTVSSKTWVLVLWADYTRSADHSRSVAASLCARRQRPLPLRHRRTASPAVGFALSAASRPPHEHIRRPSHHDRFPGLCVQVKEQLSDIR